MVQSKKVALLCAWILLLLLVVFSSNVPAETTEEMLKKDFPGLVFHGIIPTPVKGIYAVDWVGKEIVFYLPENGIVITWQGQMIGKDGINLTEEAKREFLSRHYQEIPLAQGIKVGTGQNTVVEITDPNCPYCRGGAKYFAGRSDVTRYVFFWPLSPDSEQKVRHILCAQDRVKMYEEVMAGKYDNGVTLNNCQNPDVDAQMKAYKDLGEKIGMTGTPVYYINGKAVLGANIPLIEVMLGESASKVQDVPKTTEAPKPAEAGAPKVPEKSPSP